MTRLLVLLVLVGCGPDLTSRSSPPPGRIATFAEDDGHYDVELSQGVALAITCEYNGPCRDVVVSTSDESIVDVKGATFGALEGGAHVYTRPATPAGIVLVGKLPGKARVKVKTAKGAKTIHVTVVPPPAHGAHSTAVARP